MFSIFNFKKSFKDLLKFESEVLDFIYCGKLLNSLLPEHSIRCFLSLYGKKATLNCRLFRLLYGF